MSMKQSDKIKLAAAAVMLVVAAVVLAWNFGLFGGEGKPGDYVGPDGRRAPAAPAAPTTAPPTGGALHVKPG